MRCFNHPDIEAVATCQNCGKGLCRECAAKYTPCLCDSCATQIQQDRQRQAQTAEEQKKQKYKNALVDTRSEFVKTALLGVVLAVVFVAVLWGDPDIGVILPFCMGFGLPFGWKLLTYVQSFFPVTIWGTFLFWAIWCAFKAVLSIYIGIPAFIFQLIKTISAQRKINFMK